MTAKEEARRRPLRMDWVMRACECAIRFLLGAVLAGAEIFGGYALFGVALVGVTGSVPERVAALLGAVLGYLSFRGFLEGLRYVAAAMMLFAVGLALYDFPIYRTPWFMPAVSAALNGLVGFVYLSAGGWTGENVVYFLTEVAMTGFAVYFYRLAFSVWEERRRDGRMTPPQLTGLLVLGATLLMALARVTVGRISAGRVLAALAVMIAGWKGGVGAGAVAGIAAGLAMELSAVTVSTSYILPYALGGLLTGVFSRQGRLWSMMAYLVSSGAAVLWTWTGGGISGPLGEGLAAGVILLLLPEKLFRRFASLSRQEAPREEDARTRTYTASRLRRTAGAFRSVSESLEGLSALPPGDGENLKLFDRAADTVCAGCSQRALCWQQDSSATKSALMESLPKILDRGEARSGDFPGWFAGRCLHLDRFLESVSRELDVLLARRRYDSRIQESRAAVRAQYGQLALVLERAALEMSADLAVDTRRQRQVKQRLTALGLEGRCAVFADEHHRLRLELEGQGMDRLAEPEELERLSQVMECPLRVEDQEKDRLCLAQKEPLMVVAGVCALGKDGLPVSGDTGGWFKDESGRLCFLLCDGMGSGPEAHGDSDSALRLIEQFLRAGLSPRNTLKTVGEALALKGEAEGGFTTVDLLQLDLFTGRGALLKLGAAPTYFRQDGAVVKLAGASLPAGLLPQPEADPDVFPLEVHPGDCLVMVSDGITAGQGDNWLQDALRDFDGASPQELAQRLLAESRDQPGGADDRTIIVVAIRSRD